MLRQNVFFGREGTHGTIAGVRGAGSVTGVGESAKESRSSLYDRTGVAVGVTQSAAGSAGG